MPEAVDQAPFLQACHPLALFGQETAFAGLEPAFGVVRANADVAILGRNVHVAHHHQGLVIAELGFQQNLQIAVETLLGRELGRMVTAFTLREIPVHDGNRLAVGIGERTPDEAPLGIVLIAGKTLAQAQRL
ncbi:hypothetical protein D3C80_1012930 [compost metagenome]